MYMSATIRDRIMLVLPVYHSGALETAALLGTGAAGPKAVWPAHLADKPLFGLGPSGSVLYCA